MSPQSSICWSFTFLALILGVTTPAPAAIYNWQTGEVIPGTEAITPGPSLNLQFWNTDAQNLQYAALSGLNLSSSNFIFSWFDHADFATANMGGANLTFARLANADFTNALTKGTCFDNTTTKGFAKEQLYSTASYKNKELGNIGLGGNNISGWDLGGQNLAGASFHATTLRGAILTGTDLTGTDFGCADLTGASLAGANLTGADLDTALVSGADFTGAVVKGARIYWNLKEQQVYSTASYKSRDLSGIDLGNIDLSSWDLHGQYLAGSSLSYITLTNTDFGLADLRGVQFSGCMGTPIRHNTIWAGGYIWIDGSITGLQLASGEELDIRNYSMGITVANSWTMDKMAVLKMVLAGGWGSTISALVTPDLDGTLNLSFADGINPASLIGTQFKLFNWNGNLAAGDHFDNIVTIPGVAWNTSRLYTDGIVTLTSVPEPATLSLLAIGGVAMIRRRSR
jgi:uncharacterized protein YjbI with pentapeptide repeats